MSQDDFKKKFKLWAIEGLKARQWQWPIQDSVKVKFRLNDGSDIGPFQFSHASTVSVLKEKIFSEWPKDKKKLVAPKAANDIKLICGGKVLENGQCKTIFGEQTKGVIIIHASVIHKTDNSVFIVGSKELKINLATENLSRCPVRLA